MPKGIKKKESKGKKSTKMPKMSLAEHKKMMKNSGRAY